ncbi:MAG: M48 family metallopeptidase [Planctomycetota bacterium]|jgi:STE24 endopeptidase
MDSWSILLHTILIGGFCIHLVVEWLNLSALVTELPEEFRGLYDDERYATSQRYLREKTRFHLLVGGIDLALLLLAIHLGLFGWLAAWVGSLSESVVLQGLAFFVVLGGVKLVLDLPGAIYHTFWIEERYGFNRTTQRTFILDRLKGVLLSILLGGPLLAAVIWFFAHQDLAWLWAWGLFAGFNLVMMVIGPALIMPLFFRCTPLEEGELKEAVTRYAANQNFKLGGIAVADGSKRSSKANAFFTGLGATKRIVLFDTLIENHSVPELLAVLAHEMGHYRRRHVIKLTAVNLLAMGGLLYLMGRLIGLDGIHAAFGVAGTPVYAGFLFAGILFAPLNAILSLAGNALSRRCEFQADAYAASTVEGGAKHLSDGLKRLTVDHLGNLTPHPLKVALAYSHPPVLQRLRALRIC